MVVHTKQAKWIFFLPFLARDFPEYVAYTTPVYFQSDWLNQYWDSHEKQDDDYRFVYMGPKGSW